MLQIVNTLTPSVTEDELKDMKKKFLEISKDGETVPFTGMCSSNTVLDVDTVHH